MASVLAAFKALGLAAYDRLTAEPVMVLAVVQCALALGVSFGLHWSSEQVGAVVAFSAALLGLIARKQVTPA